MGYNDELTNAGVLLALDGLHPPSRARGCVSTAVKPSVTDGPFAEAKEVIGGYWMIQARSREEAHRVGLALPRCGRRRDRGPAGVRDVGLPRGGPGG